MSGIEVLRVEACQEPPWYGTVCPVVWGDGGREAPSHPINHSVAKETHDTYRSNGVSVIEIGKRQEAEGRSREVEH